uniref:Uncharacterized protein n=1 Tax=Aegilops tauschii subsp. strangulata TaxID=200361 RepID=A0A453HU10_AEGTS
MVMHTVTVLDVQALRWMQRTGGGYVAHIIALPCIYKRVTLLCFSSRFLEVLL